MNGFDRSDSSEAAASEAAAVEREPLFPDDFSPDEAMFASELRELFSIEREELPPLFIQTLVGEELHQPATAGFEHKMTYRVFRELSLPRGPLYPKPSMILSWPLVVESIVQMRRLSRTAVGVMGSVLSVMLMSVVLASPSFADGLRILLGHTGVQQVQSYPKNVHAANANTLNGVASADALAAMPLYWAGPTAGSYTYLGMRQLHPEDWSTGAIADVQYRLKGATKGSGILDVRMFKVSSKYDAVLQVVRAGSAHVVNVGSTEAVYVDGAWEVHGQRQVWQVGARSALLFEKDGVVFWIVGDPRDGATQEQLIAFASQLKPAAHRELMPDRLTIRMVGRELTSLVQYDPADDELYALYLHGTTPDKGLVSLVQFQSRGPLIGAA